MTALEQVFCAQDAMAERLLARLPQIASDAGGETLGVLPGRSGSAASGDARAAGQTGRAQTAQGVPPWEETGAGYSRRELPDAAFLAISPKFRETASFDASAEMPPGVIPAAQNAPAVTAAALSRAFERDARRYE